MSEMLGPADVEALTGRWDYASLSPSVQVGQGCFLERRDSFGRCRSRHQPGVRLGDRVHVYMWSSFSVDPDGLLVVGDDCLLVGAVFMCAHRITLGQRVVVSYNVTIADSDFHPIDPQQRRLDAIANAPEGDRSSRPPFISRPVVIEDDVSVGIGAIILKGVTIGRGACIGAGAVVTHDVPPSAYVIGNPARQSEGTPW